MLRRSVIFNHGATTPEAQAKYAVDVALAAKLDDLLAAVREADAELRATEARRAGVAEIHGLAKKLDAALTDAMYAAYAKQRAAIGIRGYDDRIFTRKAKAKPEIHQLTTEAERLLTLRENHRMNRIPEVPRVPTV
jgi:hypothetical protein